MTIKALFGKNGNIKLGNTWTFSKLATDKLFISEIGTCTGSCGKYCAGCSKACYVVKSYRYPSVVKGHMRNSLAFRLDLFKAFDDLRKQLMRARKKPSLVRINQSGEMESELEVRLWSELAKEFPNIRFWFYTKAFDLVTPLLLDGSIPDNMTVLFSIWHEYGIQEFKKVMHLDNVKAFVYCDGFDYEAHGIHVTTMCNAYDKNGKLNHELTCDKCTKCFSRLASHKIIGCFEH